MAGLVRFITAGLATALVLAVPCVADGNVHGLRRGIGVTTQPARGKPDHRLMRTLKSASGDTQKRQAEGVTIEIGEVLEDDLVGGSVRRLLQLRGCSIRLPVHIFTWGICSERDATTAVVHVMRMGSLVMCMFD